MMIKRVGILYHPMIKATRVEAEGLQEFLAARGVSAWLCSAWEAEQARKQMDGTGLLLTVGGDGTILRAAQIAAPAGVPITGINLGKLGFLTEMNADEARDKLPSLLAGKDSWLDERAMLAATPVTSEKKSRSYHALNDVVAARGEFARAISIEALVDGQHLTTYRADGVIAATATGSTGYALAAGGPILYPSSQDCLLVPIAPHLNFRNAVLLPGTAELRLQINAVHPATLSIDGHVNLPLSGGDTVTIRRSPRKTRFLRTRPAASFYSTLEEKLKGKR